jgi:UDPglucose--hexose-1-phosphate uridylyltransferase
MPEFRQNLATTAWIIIAAERAVRPEAFTRLRPPMDELPPFSETCPFCPGNEAMTPPAILTLPPPEGGEPWLVRVIPNKFPALSPCDDAQHPVCSQAVGPYLWRAGVGHHEVVIETPLHNHDLPLMRVDELAQLMRAYRERYNALSALPTSELVVIFRNHGPRAGTSIIHPHSQIVASSIVPFLVRHKLTEGQRHYDTYGRCVYCDMLAFEQEQGTRVIADNTHFLAIAPYASSVPYEIWVLPRRHGATFGRVSEDEVHDLANTLQDMLARLWRLLDDPDYNFVIDTAPEHMAGVPFYHWHLEIYPKLTTPAGFEIGSGIGINVVPPETAAQQLRETDGSRVAHEERGT